MDKHISLTPSCKKIKGGPLIHQVCKKVKISKFKSCLAADVIEFRYQKKPQKVSETEAGRMYEQTFIGIHEEFPFETK